MEFRDLGPDLIADRTGNVFRLGPRTPSYECRNITKPVLSRRNFVMVLGLAPLSLLISGKGRPNPGFSYRSAMFCRKV
jgi:hypothetical protein